MFSDVEIKMEKRNKILFSRDSECLQDLPILYFLILQALMPCHK